jgi:hypothetical protein
MKCGYLHVHTVGVFTMPTETFEELSSTSSKSAKVTSGHMLIVDIAEYTSPASRSTLRHLDVVHLDEVNPLYSISPIWLSRL